MTFFFRVPEFEIEVRKQILQHRLHAHPDGRFGQRVGPAFQHLGTGAAGLLDVVGQFVGGPPGQRWRVGEDDDRRQRLAFFHQDQFGPDRHGET